MHYPTGRNISFLICLVCFGTQYTFKLYRCKQSSLLYNAKNSQPQFIFWTWLLFNLSLYNRALMSYSIWLCSKRIIFFSTSQIFHFWNKVCEKKGNFFVSLCTTLPYIMGSKNVNLKIQYVTLLFIHTPNVLKETIIFVEFLKILSNRPTFCRLHVIVLQMQISINK